MLSPIATTSQELTPSDSPDSKAAIACGSGERLTSLTRLCPPPPVHVPLTCLLCIEDGCCPVDSAHCLPSLPVPPFSICLAFGCPKNLNYVIPVKPQCDFEDGALLSLSCELQGQLITLEFSDQSPSPEHIRITRAHRMLQTMVTYP